MKYLAFLFDCALQLSLAPEAAARVVSTHRMNWLQRIDNQIALLTLALAAGDNVYVRLIEYKKLRTLINFSTIEL